MHVSQISTKGCKKGFGNLLQIFILKKRVLFLIINTYIKIMPNEPGKFVKISNHLFKIPIL